MTIFLAIIAFIKSVLSAIPILSKYFPAKTATDRIKEGEHDIANAISQMENEGRPK